jgi:hypothetical protein
MKFKMKVKAEGSPNEVSSMMKPSILNSLVQNKANSLSNNTNSIKSARHKLSLSKGNKKWQ